MSAQTQTESSGPRLSIVLGTIGVLAVVLGVGAFASYANSENYLHASFEELTEKGAQLTAEECIDEVMDWHKRCEAMKSLCEHAIPMSLSHCLKAKDRTADCEALGEGTDTAQWTYQMCTRHEVTRRNKKACTAAYRALSFYCRSDQTGVLL